MKAAVLGASGYTGMLLLRLLSSHKNIESLIAVSTTKTGETIESGDPGLFGNIPGRYIGIDELESAEPDVIFSALPHLASLPFYKGFIGKAVIIDLSADLRYETKEGFEKAYGTEHAAPEFIGKAVFGLSEWYRDKVKTHDLIANPGCYPTCTLLPLLPLLKEGIVEGDLTTTALSGISGAGKKAAINNLFVERSENCNAYNPGKKHRHQSEIQKELDYTGVKSNLLFTPHLVPLRRGMFVTTTAYHNGLNHEQLKNVYSEYYGKDPFIKINGSSIPETSHLWGSNRCDIGWEICDDRVLLFSAIDNLMKGASGQAIQNMNIRFGFDETTGLRTWGDL
ncbi:N-acetyl-gamma-glutamyl-phosphate reductase [Spirochaeta isovalerica]|uniref:N-acetyl-gamma-glutamyl-phosphate reductase n=1 Tax=Spirochaeta isovalerica TaxID=150 RepID=A0A841RGI4_9SPIO|nr:N-acetyl-gamma-glutamyl-phosphate reductase [Spirochaeta isovalerica]MBB6482501.1 N-acetyl-gamma-glutamyl-phosphate reductase [Spirochaeta isovalerica]